MPGHEPEACTKTVSHEEVEARVDAVLDEDYNGGVGPQLLSTDEMMKAMLISMGVGFFVAMVVMENIPIEKKTSATYFGWYVGSIGVSLLISVIYFKLRNKKVCEYASQQKAQEGNPSAPAASDPGATPGSVQGAVASDEAGAQRPSGQD